MVVPNPPWSWHRDGDPGVDQKDTQEDSALAHYLDLLRGSTDRAIFVLNHSLGESESKNRADGLVGHLDLGSTVKSISILSSQICVCMCVIIDWQEFEFCSPWVFRWQSWPSQRRERAQSRWPPPRPSSICSARTTPTALSLCSPPSPAGRRGYF